MQTTEEPPLFAMKWHRIEVDHDLSLNIYFVGIVDFCRSVTTLTSRVRITLQHGCATMACVTTDLAMVLYSDQGIFFKICITP